VRLIETVRVRDGTAPLWELHVRRLSRSCRELGIPFPHDLTLPQGGADRAVRIEVHSDGVELSERPVGSPDPVRLVTTRVVHQRYPYKTTDRAQFDRAMAEARAAGADDGLLLTAEGQVAETSIWSVFWWEGDRLCAPALDLGILPAVSRERIAALHPIEQRRAARRELDGNALFLANAVRGIVQVTKWDGVPIARSGSTAVLSEHFWP
jgi:branched-subunit amino acid aminotransferase/4-amino-4-deoxychorismate lyase